jgi:hypothetical protein
MFAMSEKEIRVPVELPTGGMNGINEITIRQNEDGSLTIDIEGWSSDSEEWAGSASIPKEEAARIIAFFRA